MEGSPAPTTPLLSGYESAPDAIRIATAQHRQADPAEERAYDRSELVDVHQEELPGSRWDDAKGAGFSWRKLWLFMGPGFLMSIAYLDPGNIESDLQAGAQAGYFLLWLLLLATLMGLFIQLLAARLGVASGSHLAEICREEYPSSAKIVLWIMTEVAIIGADIQEVIGSAIALRLLSNGFISLWAGVLMTGFYGFLFLFLENFGVRKLEALFGLLILFMGVAFAGVFSEAQPSSRSILEGLVIPRVPANAVDKAVGIVGCVIMPHNIFLHSALVQSRAIDVSRKSRIREALRYYSIESAIAILISLVINVFIMSVFAKSFFGTAAARNIGLANAGEYLQTAYGGSRFPIKYIWAAGLLAAGQSSTMTSIYTGQFVMAGFLNLRVRKWIRVVITRSVAIIPTIIIALAFDSSENELDRLNEWLNVLQSVQLPFALIPLLTFVDNKRIMGSFAIGSLLKAGAGLIALLVVAINFYLLAIFLLESAIRSILILIVLGALVIMYAGFIVYLVAHPFVQHRAWSTRSISPDAILVVSGTKVRIPQQHTRPDVFFFDSTPGNGGDELSLLLEFYLRKPALSSL